MPERAGRAGRSPTHAMQQYRRRPLRFWGSGGDRREPERWVGTATQEQRAWMPALFRLSRSHHGVSVAKVGRSGRGIRSRCRRR